MLSSAMTQKIIAVSVGPRHAFSKPNQLSIRLVAGLGVEGDAHMGEKVKHRYHAARNPDAPNLRQVHLMHAELFDELRGKGFDIHPGDMGENVTTSGIALLELPRGTRLRLGDEAVVELTGLRSPCMQIDKFRAGLKDAVLDRDEDGGVIRKSGVMAIVITGGETRPGDAIAVELPLKPWDKLTPV
jgi:MOSC domain-containing protein YiiM